MADKQSQSCTEAMNDLAKKKTNNIELAGLGLSEDERRPEINAVEEAKLKVATECGPPSKQPAARVKPSGP